jgi:hypothetical protein
MHRFNVYEKIKYSTKFGRFLGSFWAGQSDVSVGTYISVPGGMCRFLTPWGEECTTAYAVWVKYMGVEAPPAKGAKPDMARPAYGKKEDQAEAFSDE